jgi:beta-phosphoglucomutase family hydrolase
MIKAVIFDLDGVILDSEPLHFEADRLAMRDYGMEIPDEVLVSYVGVSGRDMWADLIASFGIPDTLEGILARQKAHKLKLLAETKLTAIAGIPELLDTLLQAGAAIGLASSSPRYFIQSIIENLGIASYFQAVASGEEVARSKPSPDVFLLAAERLGVDPADCIVIEDSAHGVRAAKAAGMYCVGYVNPTSGEQDLSLADLTVSSFCQSALLEYALGV